ncbi:MAG: hypothetical protein Q8L37_06605 [Candidatus Gottesmanbacteria bacterium]|nr:hypothetical protein [Candidatus Gottesmanbacteria bacterium]
MNFSITHRVTGKTVSLISLIALLIFLPLLLLATYETATIISRAAGIPANITVNAGIVTNEKVDPTFMYAVNQNEQETSNFKPKWIRMNQLYDTYDMVKKVDGALVFDFSRLDRDMKTMYTLGTTLVINLSSMPPAIAKNSTNTNPPTNWDDWALVVQKTIEHVSGSSGLNIRGVYYEVWNEPDHEKHGGWNLDGEKNYLTLYKYAAIGAAQARETQSFYIGGPATTGLYKDWIVKLAQSGYRLDFLSWHTYSDDPGRFEADQKNISSWLVRYPEIVLLPRLITESGFTRAKDPRDASSFASAYTAAVFRQLASDSPRSLFTLQPPNTLMTFLDHMAGTRLYVTGEGTWVTAMATKQGEKLNILLVNFDPNGSHTETVPVQITALPNGTYIYTQQYFDRRQQDEVKKQQVVITDGNLMKQIHMPAQSVILLELILPPRH